jgi:tight adherence protein B
VSLAVGLAGVAGALAVAGAWEAVAAIEQASAARAIGRVLGPLRAAGADGREPSSAERRRLAVVGAGTLLGAGWLVGGPVAGGALATAGPWGVRRLVLARRRRWRADLARAAPAAARALADALAGGNAVHGAVAVAARDGGVPGAAGAELRAAARALALGDRTDDVLERLRRRAGDPAWDAIVAAVLLQRDAGGDLARLLRTIAARLEEGARAEADARSATAQARFTAWLVTLLPAGAAVLAELGQPGYLASLLGAPATAAMLIGAAVLEAAAIVAIRRIARVGSA